MSEDRAYFFDVSIPLDESRCHRVPQAMEGQAGDLRDPQTALRMRLRDLAMSRVGYGYRRLQVLIEREGGHVNHKRVYHLYREEGLTMRRRPPRRRKASLKSEQRPLAVEMNECWSMDFMSDELFDGRMIRLLTMVDNHTRESLAIHMEQRIRG